MKNQVVESGFFNGAKVCFCACSTNYNIDSIAINDVYGETGVYEELLEKHGLSVDNIIKINTRMVQS